MEKTAITLGQLLYQDIDENEYLNEIYDAALFNHVIKLFGFDCPKKEIIIADALRFADILSKSVHPQHGDSHRIWAQELVALLHASADSNSADSAMIAYYLGSVLFSAGNYQGLALRAAGYSSMDVLDRTYNVFKRSFFQVPASPDKYFLQPQKTVYDHFENPYFSYSGPTSMGKSFVMQMFIKQTIQSATTVNFCILVPSKALINEVSHDVSEDLQGLLKQYDYRIVTSAGAYILQEESDKHNFIFIMTPERLMYLLIAFPEMPLGYVFIDEAQKISLVEGRSAFYYQIISMLWRRTNKPHFIFASPNIPNPEVYLQLVPDAEESQGSVLASTYSPVSQTKILVDCNTHEVKYYNEHTKQLHLVHHYTESWNLHDIIHRCGSDAKNIIYCKSKDDVVQFALSFAKDLQPLHEKELDDLATDIRNEVHDAYYLAETITKGVAYHMGYLPTTIRLRIEDLFRKKKGIRTLFCTSTLLEGVNLPADNLFVTHYNKGGKPMEAIDFKNLIGRVGRIQYNLYGNVYLVCLDSSVDQNVYFDLLKKEVEPQAISLVKLNPAYKEYVVKTLLSGSGKIEKQEGQTPEEYDLMRRTANNLLRDIMLEKETRVIKEFKDFLNDDVITSIRNQFAQKEFQQDDDINISVDQKARLIKYIESGKSYPKITFPGRIDYRETLSFLEDLFDIFDWATYEKGTLGNKNRLKKYVVELEHWIKGESLRQIIDEDIDYRRRNGKTVYIDHQTYKFDYKSKDHINQVITDNLNMINDVLLFRLANYFMRFSSEYRKFHNLKESDRYFSDWYEFVEYGTWEYFPINLQKNGFTREVAGYINRNKELFTVEQNGKTLLRRDLMTCGNTSVEREAQEVYYNIPELFEIVNEHES